MSKEAKDKGISIRLYEDMLEALDAYADKERKARTQVIREAITQFLNLPKESVEQKIDLLSQEIESLRSELENANQKINLFEARFERVETLLSKIDI